MREGAGAQNRRGTHWRRPSFFLMLAVVFGMSMAVAGCNGTGGGGGGGDFPSDDIEIMVPADPGGGYDQTGRAVQQALTEGGVTEQNVEVYNTPGASGTAGLTEFVNDTAGDPHQLMVMGLILVGAIKDTDAPVTLEDTTPIAELASEYDAIAVPVDSEYESLEQLMVDFEADPQSIAWGGGSAGGVDHILVGQLAEEVGVDPADANYVPYSGGGELMPAITSGDVTVGVSGLNEFADQVDAGDMRLLAVSSEEPIEGVDAPTIMDEGYDVSIANWRGIVGAPEISDEDHQSVIGMIEEMHETEEWQNTLEQNDWDDTFKTGDEFASYLEEEDQRVEESLRNLGVIE